MKKIALLLICTIFFGCSSSTEYFNKDKSRFHILKLFTYIYSEDTDPARSTIEFHNYNTWINEQSIQIRDLSSIISQNSQVYMRFNCDAFNTLHSMKINDFRQFKSDGYPLYYKESDGMKISQSDTNELDIKDKQLFSFTYTPTHTSAVSIAFTDTDTELLIIDNEGYAISKSNHRLLLKLATELLNKFQYPWEPKL